MTLYDFLAASYNLKKVTIHFSNHITHEMWTELKEHPKGVATLDDLWRYIEWKILFFEKRGHMIHIYVVIPAKGGK